MRVAGALAVVAALIVLVVVLVVTRDDGGPRLAYPQFQRRATAICLRYHRALARLGAPTTLPRISRIAKRAYRLGGTERDRLGELRPPKEADGDFSDMLDAFETADALLPDLWRAADDGDAATAQQLAQKGSAAVRRGNRAAAAVGLSDCRRG